MDGVLKDYILHLVITHLWSHLLGHKWSHRRSNVLPWLFELALSFWHTHWSWEFHSANKSEIMQNRSQGNRNAIQQHNYKASCIFALSRLIFVTPRCNLIPTNVRFRDGRESIAIKFFYAENDKIDEKCWMIGQNKNKFRITHTKDEPEGMDGYGHHSIFWLDVGGHNFHKLTVGYVAHQMDRFQILGRQIKAMEVALQRYLLVLWYG